METILEWENTTSNAEHSVIEEELALINLYKSDLANAEQSLLNLAKCKNVLQKISTNLSLIPMLAELEQQHVLSIQHYLVIGYEQAVEDYDATQKNIDHYKSCISTLTASVAEKTERLSTSQTQRTVVTLEEVQSQLRSLPKVIPDSIVLSYDREHQPTLEWQFDVLYYTPSHVPVHVANKVHFNDFPVRIPIAKTKVKVNLKTASVSISSVDNHDLANIYFAPTEPSPHPHILFHTRPCMGDFFPPFKQAIELADWATAVLIVQSFLEHANYEDGAGCNWVSFFTNFLANGDFAVQDEPGHYIIQHSDGTQSVHPVCEYLTE